MLSALVQSQAAIVAIVITLTLIAVQLTASAYSPRVVDIFKRNPDMWLLLGCYGVSIFYGFIVLKLVEGAEGEFVSQSAIWTLGWVSISFEFFVSLAYWLGAFTFVALFPYMWNIIGLLKSENIIKRLTNEITKDKILNLKEDPVQPIVDIIHGSIMKYDLETTRVGLKAVTDQVIEIIDSDNEEKISGRFCQHLRGASGLTVSKMDEGSTAEVIKNLGNFGNSTAEKGLENATLEAAMSIKRVGSTAAEKGLKGAIIWQAVLSLKSVGIAAAEKGLKVVTSQTIVLLEEVGITAAEKGLEVETSLATVSIEKVGKAATKRGLTDATQQAIISLGIVGKTSVEKGLELVTFQAVKSLGEVGEAAAEKGLENMTSLAAFFLEEVGRIAAEKGHEKAIALVTGYLFRVGRAAVEKGLEKAILQVARSLGEVGEAAAKKGLEDATLGAAMSLADLTLFSEEIVKTAIREHESKLEEKDRDSFQKFVKKYEQELEKLRAEK
jgi:hypothetical protein